jgi:hypothetical protein
MLVVLVVSEGGTSKHITRYTGPSSESPYACPAIVGIAGLSVRQGAYGAQDRSERKRLLSCGKDSHAFDESFVGHGLKLSRLCPASSPYGRLSIRMGHARRKPRLLAEKLRIIREEHLRITQAAMASEIQIEGRSKRVSDYETGNREPTLMEVLKYADLGEVFIDSLADDSIGLVAFRRLLGKQNHLTSGRTYNEH